MRITISSTRSLTDTLQHAVDSYMTMAAHGLCVAAESEES